MTLKWISNLSTQTTQVVLINAGHKPIWRLPSGCEFGELLLFSWQLLHLIVWFSSLCLLDSCFISDVNCIAPWGPALCQGLQLELDLKDQSSYSSSFPSSHQRRISGSYIKVSFGVWCSSTLHIIHFGLLFNSGSSTVSNLAMTFKRSGIFFACFFF